MPPPIGLTKRGGFVAEFVWQEQFRFVPADSDHFSRAMGKIARYHGFLATIMERYAVGCEELEAAMRDRLTIPSGPHTPETQAKVRRMSLASDAVQLDIESFYLFGKVMLDSVARATQFSFGQAHGFSLKSHHRMEDEIERYAAAKGLTPAPPEMMARINQLRREVGDLRDKRIQHPSEIRTGYNLSWGTSTQGAAVMKVTGLSHDKDAPIQSRSLAEVSADLDAYLRLWIAWWTANRDKVRLRLNPSVEAT